MNAERRRDLIRELLAGGAVATQEELGRLLRGRGIRAAQATLSRDLVALRVRRVVGPAGARYEVPGGAGEAGGALPIEPVRRLVERVGSNGGLVVVRAKSGAASTVARAIDEAGLPGVLGTLAGDDTIFIAPSRAGGGPALARRVARLFAVSVTAASR